MEQAYTGNPYWQATLTVGAYLALMVQFQRIGMIFLNLCRHLVALQSGMTALERVAEMLNEPMGLTQELRLQQEAAEVWACCLLGDTL